MFAFCDDGKICLEVTDSLMLCFPPTLEGARALGREVASRGADSVACSSSIDFPEDEGVYVEGDLGEAIAEGIDEVFDSAE